MPSRLLRLFLYNLLAITIRISPTATPRTGPAIFSVVALRCAAATDSGEVEVLDGADGADPRPDDDTPPMSPGADVKLVEIGMVAVSVVLVVLPVEETLLLEVPLRLVAVDILRLFGGNARVLQTIEVGVDED